MDAVHITAAQTERFSRSSGGSKSEAGFGGFFFSVVWFLPSVDFIISARKVDSREKKTNKKNSQHFQQLEWIQQNNINQKKNLTGMSSLEWNPDPKGQKPKSRPAVIYPFNYEFNCGLVVLDVS